MGLPEMVQGTWLATPHLLPPRPTRNGLGQHPVALCSGVNVIPVQPGLPLGYVAQLQQAAAAIHGRAQGIPKRQVVWRRRLQLCLVWIQHHQHPLVFGQLRQPLLQGLHHFSTQQIMLVAGCWLLVAGCWFGIHRANRYF